VVEEEEEGIAAAYRILDCDRKDVIHHDVDALSAQRDRKERTS
jgi:hypothetical protein